LGVEGDCLHTRKSFPYAPLTPHYSSTYTSSSPSNSRHPLSLPWPQGPHPSAYFALTNTVATPPSQQTISWTTPPHHPNSPYLCRHCRHQRLPGSVLYSTVRCVPHPYTQHTSTALSLCTDGTC
jgi:hypothetical protein